MKRWEVLLPNPFDLDGPWISVLSTENYEEAIAFCDKYFGGCEIFVLDFWDDCEDDIQEEKHSCPFCQHLAFCTCDDK